MKTRIKASDAAFWVMAVWSVAALTFVAVAAKHHGRGDRASAQATGPSKKYVANWSEYASRGHGSGPDASNLVVVVFSDFECPFCRMFAGTIDSLHKAYPAVRFVERNYPLVGLHEQAFDAALAAECAAGAGRYPEMRHALFRNAELLRESAWGQLGVIAGVRDTAALLACVHSQAKVAAVRQDMEAGRQLGVTGTPTVMVNDTLYATPPTLEELNAVLSTRALRPPKQSPRAITSKAR